jgi:hypothetical protein
MYLITLCQCGEFSTYKYYCSGVACVLLCLAKVAIVASRDFPRKITLRWDRHVNWAAVGNYLVFSRGKKTKRTVTLRT